MTPTTTRSRLSSTLRRRRDDLLAVPRTEDTARFWASVRSRHPRFVEAVLADARVTAARRGERYEYRSTLDGLVQAVRLCVVTESFLAQCCYRAKARCQALRIPVLPRFLHRAAVVRGQVAIGDPVVVDAGVFIPHGQVCIDGMTTIGAGATISPFVSIGLKAGDFRGPTIGAHASIGTGVRILGPWKVGAHATVGANAVVTADVPDGVTVVGIPARPVG